VSVNVPVNTVERPITVIDYIASLDACRTHLEVGQFSDLVPAAVRADERFCRAVAAKLAAIKERRQDRKRA
jgi:hypothetical protein